MKSKKGFTLVELLAVLVIFGILCTFAIPPILNQVNKSKDKVNNTSIDIIGKAASLYFDNNLNASSTYCVSLQELVDQDLLQAPIKDLETGEIFDLNQIVQIKTDASKKETYKILSVGTSC